MRSIFDITPCFLVLIIVFALIGGVFSHTTTILSDSRDAIGPCIHGSCGSTPQNVHVAPRTKVSHTLISRDDTQITVTSANTFSLSLCDETIDPPCFYGSCGTIKWNDYNYGSATVSRPEIYGPFTNGENRNIMMTDGNGARILKVNSDLSFTETAHYPVMCQAFPAGVVGNTAYAVTPPSCQCSTNSLECNKPVLTVTPSNGAAYDIPIVDSSRGVSIFDLPTPVTADAVVLDSDPNGGSYPFYSDAPINNPNQLDGSAVLVSFFQYGMMNRLSENGAKMGIWEMSNQWSYPGYYNNYLAVDTGSDETIYIAMLSPDWQTINQTLHSGVTVSMTINSSNLYDQWGMRNGPAGGLIIASGLNTDSPTFTSDTSLFKTTAGAWLETTYGGTRNYMWVYAPDGSDVGRIYDLSNGVPSTHIATLDRLPYQNMIDVSIYTHVDGRILLGGYQIPSYTDAFVLGYLAATNQVYLIDITDVSDLQVLDSYDLGSDATFSMTGNGKGRFFVGNHTEIIVLDVDSNDKFVMSYKLDAGLDSPIIMLTVVDDLLYVANGVDGIMMWDLLQEPPVLVNVFKSNSNPGDRNSPGCYGAVRVSRGQTNVRELFTVSATQNAAASTSELQSVQVESWVVVPPPSLGCVDVTVPDQIALVIATSTIQSNFDCRDLEAVLDSMGIDSNMWNIYSVDSVDDTLYVSVWADESVTETELNVMINALGTYLGATDSTNIAYGRTGVSGQKASIIVAKIESSASVLMCCFLFAAMLATLLI